MKTADTFQRILFGFFVFFLRRILMLIMLYSGVNIIYTNNILLLVTVVYNKVNLLSLVFAEH